MWPLTSSSAPWTGDAWGWGGLLDVTLVQRPLPPDRPPQSAGVLRGNKTGPEAEEVEGVEEELGGGTQVPLPVPLKIGFISWNRPITAALYDTIFLQLSVSILCDMMVERSRSRNEGEKRTDLNDLKKTTTHRTKPQKTLNEMFQIIIIIIEEL